MIEEAKLGSEGSYTTLWYAHEEEEEEEERLIRRRYKEKMLRLQPQSDFTHFFSFTLTDYIHTW